ncbi:MAG: AAA family ATPase, partial [Burkholderiaceae bacterium]|nr:AAA family ATPase [Burkholderiaceae bacterium]
MTSPPPQRPRFKVPGIRLGLRHAGRLLHDDSVAVDLEPKDAVLLAYLALEGPTPRGRLAALLWPEADEERARGNLRQRLLRLKRATGVELVVGNPLAQLAAGVAHDLDEVCDVLAAIDPAQAGGLAEWLQAQRDRRERARIQWLTAAADQAEAAGELEVALAHALALVELDPLSEHAHRRVMTLHYLRGDAAAALAAYERCRQILRRELHAAPSPETEAVRARLERAAVPAERASAAAVPISVLRPPRLIGRDAQWDALQAAWDAGEPAVVLGEAGMGKTRLVTDFARARNGVVVTSARPGDERVVYALVARLLRQLPREPLAALDAAVRTELARLLPEFGAAEPIRTEADRARFFNAVAAALAAASPTIAGLVIDDLHFADEASVELLRYLAGDGALRWLFTARPAEIGKAAGALIDGVRGKGRVIELAPLTAQQIDALVASLDLPGVDTAAWAPRLARRTGGNPLFVLETIKAWLAQPDVAQDPAENLPAASRVVALIERRVGRLSPEAIRLARCAAVAGQDFSAELAAHVLGARPLDLADAWAELERA